MKWKRNGVNTDEPSKLSNHAIVELSSEAASGSNLNSTIAPSELITIRTWGPAEVRLRVYRILVTFQSILDTSCVGAFYLFFYLQIHNF